MLYIQGVKQTDIGIKSWSILGYAEPFCDTKRNSQEPHEFQQGQAAYTESEACLLTKGPAGTGPRRDYSTRIQQQQGVSLPVWRP